MIHSLANKRGGQAAIASQTLTHRRVLEGFTFGNGNTVVPNAQSGVSHPAALAIGRSNPDLDTGFSIFDLQGPLSFEFSDLAVGDDDSLERVDYNQVGLSENEFWFNPKQIGRGSDENCNCEIYQQAAGWVENGLVDEEYVQDYCQTSPDQIALWAKHGIHASIIAGVTAVGKGK